MVNFAFILALLIVTACGGGSSTQAISGEPSALSVPVSTFAPSGDAQRSVAKDAGAPVTKAPEEAPVGKPESGAEEIPVNSEEAAQPPAIDPEPRLLWMKTCSHDPAVYLPAYVQTLKTEVEPRYYRNLSSVIKAFSDDSFEILMDVQHISVDHRGEVLIRQQFTDGLLKFSPLNARRGRTLTHTVAGVTKTNEVEASTLSSGKIMLNLPYAGFNLFTFTIDFSKGKDVSLGLERLHSQYPVYEDFADMKTVIDSKGLKGPTHWPLYFHKCEIIVPEK